MDTGFYHAHRSVHDLNGFSSASSSDNDDENTQFHVCELKGFTTFDLQKLPTTTSSLLKPKPKKKLKHEKHDAALEYDSIKSDVLSGIGVNTKDMRMDELLEMFD